MSDAAENPELTKFEILSIMLGVFKYILSEPS